VDVKSGHGIRNYIDPQTANAKKLAETLNKSGATLVSVEQNLIDLIWGKDRPARPNEKVKVHADKFSGKPFQEKISDLRKELKKEKREGCIICRHPV
jgi:Xaa-Pro aminopeptidase